MVKMSDEAQKMADMQMSGGKFAGVRMSDGMPILRTEESEVDLKRWNRKANQ